MTEKELRDYELSNEIIRRTIMMNDFQLFFTIKDKRPKNSYKRFRNTDQLDSGHIERQKVVSRVMSYFKRVYKIRGKITPESEIFYYCISESGKGNDKQLTHNGGHCHLLIGFKMWSKYYWNPAERIEDFKKYITGRSEVSCFKEGFKTKNNKFAYLDICTSLENKGEVEVIYRKFNVADYCSKEELGTLHHTKFYKSPFWRGDIQFPDRKDLPIDLLTGKVA